jgi:hypothetical protein
VLYNNDLRTTCTYSWGQYYDQDVRKF